MESETAFQFVLLAPPRARVEQVPMHFEIGLALHFSSNDGNLRTELTSQRNRTCGYRVDTFLLKKLSANKLFSFMLRFVYAS